MQRNEKANSKILLLRSERKSAREGPAILYVGVILKIIDPAPQHINDGCSKGGVVVQIFIMHIF